MSFLRRLLGREPETSRVLFIGNSLTRFEALHDLPALLTRMARSRGVELITGTLARNAASLGDYREDAEAGAALRSGDWDLVVLQENSERALLDEAATGADVRVLSARIRAAGRRTALFATWPPADRAGSAEKLSRVYREFAAETGALCVPVGDAWARSAAERPELRLRMKDGVHPSAAGAYLSACVFYESLFAGGLRGASAEARADDLAAVRALASAQARAGEDDRSAVADGELQFLRSIAA